jgi:hypothetical protein
MRPCVLMCAVQMEEFPVPTYTPLYLESGGKLSVAAPSQSSFNAFVYVGRLGGQGRVCPFPRCAFGPVNSPCVCCCHSFESSCVSCAGNRYDPALPVPSIGGNSTSPLALWSQCHTSPCGNSVTGRGGSPC